MTAADLDRDARGRRRVVVTGVGLVSPLGLTTAETWSGLLAGRSGIGPITRFDATDYACRFAGEVKGFDPATVLDRKEVKKFDTFIHYAVSAAKQAIADAGLAVPVPPEEAEAVGVCIGAGIGGLPLIEETHKTLLEKGPRRVSPFFIPGLIANMPSGLISILTGAKGPNTATVTACATSAHALGDATNLIRHGEADVMIAGGTESVIAPLAIGGFAAMRALSTRNDDPEAASRPWDKDRDGFVLAEGAGILVLEEMGRARSRGATVYAEVIGYGMSGDAYHISAPSEDGDGPFRVMRNALRDAATDPADLQYVNAHGTSTPHGDRIETVALKRLLGEGARNVAISSTKSMTGHLLGAAGGLEAGILALTIRNGVVPPTINYRTPDPDCDLDYTPNVAREVPVRVGLSNSFGFGGTNACLVMRKV
ncbi:beta-ketoacyl-ACP synthase II [Acidobacteria bacterium ACD]|nr:MAG: beta-ketoacyl-[acyl-carrier-protein] synthase II [Acidobacteriota bacterium]MCE7957190.1 beta-ketoacyl-[acyl-carrier-protein] synthase II [Acidobacteria bacterium ACB2]MDL1949578.1 beta-ketoacyl-ACP synthase II [Acidobacteria bacterium ACD]